MGTPWVWNGGCSVRKSFTEVVTFEERLEVSSKLANWTKEGRAFQGKETSQSLGVVYSGKL